MQLPTIVLIILLFCRIDKIALDFLFSKKLKHIKIYLAKKLKNATKPDDSL